MIAMVQFGALGGYWKDSIIMDFLWDFQNRSLDAIDHLKAACVHRGPA